MAMDGGAPPWFDHVNADHDTVGGWMKLTVLGSLQRQTTDLNPNGETSYVAHATLCCYAYIIHPDDILSLHLQSLTARPWKMMVGRQLSLWDGKISGTWPAMFFFQRMWDPGISVWTPTSTSGKEVPMRSRQLGSVGILCPWSSTVTWHLGWA